MSQDVRLFQTACGGSSQWTGRRLDWHLAVWTTSSCPIQQLYHTDLQNIQRLSDKTLFQSCGCSWWTGNLSTICRWRQTIATKTVMLGSHNFNNKWDLRDQPSLFSSYWGFQSYYSCRSHCWYKLIICCCRFTLKACFMSACFYCEAATGNVTCLQPGKTQAETDTVRFW